MAWTFQRTGSCRVWVRTLRQKRSSPCSASEDEVPLSSKSFSAASSPACVLSTLAWATAIDAAATVSSVGLAWAASVTAAACSSTTCAKYNHFFPFDFKSILSKVFDKPNSICNIACNDSVFIYKSVACPDDFCGW